MTTKYCTQYQYKLDEAKRIIDTHNYLRKPEPGDTRIVYEDFLSALVSMGGTSSETLKTVTSEDLHDICGLPILLARRLVEIFKEVE